MNNVAVDVTTLSRQVRALVDKANREGEVLLTVEGKAVAKIVPVSAKRPRQPGTARGLIHMANDFDEAPVDFRDHM